MRVRKNNCASASAAALLGSCWGKSEAVAYRIPQNESKSISHAVWCYILVSCVVCSSSSHRRRPNNGNGSRSSGIIVGNCKCQTTSDRGRRDLNSVVFHGNRRASISCMSLLIYAGLNGARNTLWTHRVLDLLKICSSTFDKRFADKIQVDLVHY